MTLTRRLVGYFVIHEMGLAKIYLYTKFDISSFARSRFTEGGLKFNFGHWTLTMPFLVVGYFVMLEMGLVTKVYQCMEFKVSSFTSSKFR